MSEGLRLEIEGAVAVITIDRPGARNALDAAALDALQDAVSRIETDDTIGAAVITGASGAFCAGADLREMAETEARYRPWAGADGPLARPCSKPTIAAVEGHAVAGGLGLALWADLRVAGETAVFGVFCRRFGVPMSDGTPTRLPAVIGRGRALDMLLTGRPVEAPEALEIGLANRVVTAGEALPTAKKLAAEIAAFPPLAARADRAAAWAAFEAGEAERLVDEADGAEAAKRKDAAEGAARFKDGAGRGGSFD